MVFVITMMGASLAIALLFASTVLSFKWWNLPLFHKHHKNKDSQQKWQYARRSGRTYESNYEMERQDKPKRDRGVVI